MVEYETRPATRDGRIAGIALSIFFFGLPLLNKDNRDYILGRKKIVKAIRKVEHREKYHYGCQLCGYQWEWEKGNPLPSVTVRPDLIANGERRLKEQEQERRDAEGAFWLSQQQKKK